ncbi:uncharacterized protein LOC143662961 [Tamandua tetradactyla]|uniref:uncharacterized protein LOC143662961 n=1 Tax=Tamandua tetradactyla TaxID=48850 RepID=UPI0040543A97
MGGIATSWKPTNLKLPPTISCSWKPPHHQLHFGFWKDLAQDSSCLCRLFHSSVPNYPQLPDSRMDFSGSGEERKSKKNFMRGIQYLSHTLKIVLRPSILMHRCHAINFCVDFHSIKVLINNCTGALFPKMPPAKPEYFHPESEPSASSLKLHLTQCSVHRSCCGRISHLLIWMSKLPSPEGISPYISLETLSSQNLWTSTPTLPKSFHLRVA